MTYNYDKLQGKIKEIFGTQDNYAKAIGCSTTSVNYKLNNKSKFTQEEIAKSVTSLKILPEEISIYFFTQKVE